MLLKGTSEKRFLNIQDGRWLAFFPPPLLPAASWCSWPLPNPWGSASELTLH